MSKPMVIVVSENPEHLDSTKKHFEGKEVTVHGYSPFQWREGLETPYFRQHLVNGIPSLVGGSNSFEANPVVPFGAPVSDSVHKMEDLEAKAIENAIFQFKGNLTEAAKALGIGRATLYRKVKLYNIDPTSARNRRRAA